MKTFWKNNTIICVDDDESIRDTYQDILCPENDNSFADIFNMAREREGNPVITEPVEKSFNVLLASSGEQALGMLAREIKNGRKIAAGFFDMRMPGGMDGYETIRAMRQMDNDLICAVVTAYTDRKVTEIRSLFTEEHEDELLYIKKPFTIEELHQTAINMVSSWNQKRRMEKFIQTIEIMQKKENSRLETLVARRTKELSRSNSALKLANNAKSKFLANMSHELRTPLNAVLGITQIMTRDKRISSEQQNNLDIISRSGRHLLMLINDILDLSKIEAGKITLNTDNIDLHHLMNDLENMMQIRTEKRGLDLIFEISPEVPRFITTDGTRLRQVLINLIGNAIKFTSKGNIWVRVNKKSGTVNSKSDNTGIHSPVSYLHFEVRDTGPGIEPRQLDSLFKAFVQTETGEASCEGTGLGLVISKKLVQLMGGKINVVSKVGQGSRFSFYIKVKPAEKSTIPVKQSSRRVIALEPGQPVFRILIVDDILENRQVLSKLLSPFGFELQEAVNGKQAFEIWQKWNPHLIWMDIRMPVMNGYEAVRKIRKTETRKTCIIAVSASTFQKKREEMISAGCDDFVHKPFYEQEIFDMMHKHLNICYVYDKTEPDNSKKISKESFVKALAEVPADLLENLEQAAKVLDTEAIKQAILKIRDINPLTAKMLEALANDYKFDTILELIKKPSGQEIS